MVEWFQQDLLWNMLSDDKDQGRWEFTEGEEERVS